MEELFGSTLFLCKQRPLSKVKIGFAPPAAPHLFIIAVDGRSANLVGGANAEIELYDRSWPSDEIPQRCISMASGLDHLTEKPDSTVQLIAAKSLPRRRELPFSIGRGNTADATLPDSQLPLRTSATTTATDLTSGAG